ncbi:MAG: hypothetical protein ACLU0O_07525 [Collinsella sp.]
MSMSNLKFKDDGRLKLLIIVGTRPEVIRLSEVIKSARRHFDCLLAPPGRTTTTRSTASSSATCRWTTRTSTWTPWAPTWARRWATSSPRATS